MSGVYSHTIEKWSGSDGVLVESVKFQYSQVLPTGLEWDGTDLWFLYERILTGTDGSDMIARLNSDDLSVGESFPVPGTELHGLAWDGSAFWSCDKEEDAIYQFDSHGNVLGKFSSPRDNPGAITFDGEYLWVTGNDWPPGSGERKLYQLAIPEPSACALLSIAAASVLLGFAWCRRRRG